VVYVEALVLRLLQVPVCVNEARADNLAGTVDNFRLRIGSNVVLDAGNERIFYKKVGNGRHNMVICIVKQESTTL
jgi:hypothetical protein